MTLPTPKIDLLSNHFYKELCRKEIFIILDEWLDVPVLADHDLVNVKLIRARQARAITLEELSDALSIDIIAREVEDTSQTGRLAIVEASITFNRDDLENAARRAAIIASVAGNSTAAFVTTHGDWPDGVDAEAQRLGVTIIRHEDPDYEPA